jgi:hypothetical protein
MIDQVVENVGIPYLREKVLLKEKLQEGPLANELNPGKANSRLKTMGKAYLLILIFFQKNHFHFLKILGFNKKISAN